MMVLGVPNVKAAAGLVRQTGESMRPAGKPESSGVEALKYYRSVIYA